MQVPLVFSALQFAFRLLLTFQRKNKQSLNKIGRQIAERWPFITLSVPCPFRASRDRCRCFVPTWKRFSLQKLAQHLPQGAWDAATGGLAGTRRTTLTPPCLSLRAEPHTVGYSQSSLIHLVGPSDCTLLGFVHGGE